MVSDKQKRVEIAVIYFLDKGFTDKRKIKEIVKRFYDFTSFEVEKAMNRLIVSYKKKLEILKE